MSIPANILFVDDEAGVLASLKMVFRSAYNVFTASTGEEALELIKQHHMHVVVSDQRMPKMMGHELLRSVKEISPGSMRLLLTGYSDMQAIINSVNEGEIYRFINKPWVNAEIKGIVASAVEIAIATETDAVDIPEAGSKRVEMVGDAGILVLDEGGEIGETVRELVGDTGQMVCGASTVKEALGRLEEVEIGLLITDVQVSGESTVPFIKVLKQQYPALKTIVLTSVSDSESAVGLINEARIFRYLTKPIAGSFFLQHITSGLTLYQKSLESPGLLKREQVEVVETPASLSLKARWLGRLSSLRLRFGKAI